MSEYIQYCLTANHYMYWQEEPLFVIPYHTCRQLFYQEHTPKVLLKDSHERDDNADDTDLCQAAHDCELTLILSKDKLAKK